MEKGKWYNVLWCSVRKGMSNGNNTTAYAAWRGKFLGIHNGKFMFSTHGKHGSFIRHVEAVPAPFDAETEKGWEYCHITPDKLNGGKAPLSLNYGACDFNPNPFNFWER